MARRGSPGCRDSWTVVGAIAAAALVFGHSQCSWASAFFVREQSAAALGSAFAGAVAGADDVTYMFFNGAALTRQQGSRVAGVGTVVSAIARFGDGDGRSANGTPIGGGNGGRNAGEVAFAPAVYALWDVGESFAAVQRVKLGLAVNAPFAFETEYLDGWIGRYYALQSRLRSIAFNPVLAYEPVSGVSLAAGLQIQYLDATLSNAIDFGTLGALNGVPGAIATAQDGFAQMTGDDWGLGWTAGMLLEPWPGTRFGVSYRSSVRHDLDGDARTRLDDAGIGRALGAAGGTTGVKARLTTPEIVTAGIHHEIDAAWAVMADVSWTHWSRLRMLRVRFDDEVREDEVTEEDWRDTWFFAVGCRWRPAENWSIRTGIGYDQSPARNRTRTPRTPVNNGLLLALGAGWQPIPPLDLAFGFSHYIIDSARIDLHGDDPGNAARGDLSGASDNAVDTFSLQLVWTF